MRSVLPFFLTLLPSIAQAGAIAATLLNYDDVSRGLNRSHTPTCPIPGSDPPEPFYYKGYEHTNILVVKPRIIELGLPTDLPIIAYTEPYPGGYFALGGPLIDDGEPAQVSVDYHGSRIKEFGVVSLCFALGANIPTDTFGIPVKGKLVVRGFDRKGKFKGEAYLPYEPSTELNCRRVDKERVFQGVRRLEITAVTKKKGKYVPVTWLLDNVKVVGREY